MTTNVKLTVSRRNFSGMNLLNSLFQSCLLKIKRDSKRICLLIGVRYPTLSIFYLHSTLSSRLPNQRAPLFNQSAPSTSQPISDGLFQRHLHL